MAFALAGFILAAAGDDWPQWRGPNRDGKAAGFKAPKTWPKELSKKWKVTVGEGVSTPALVGDRLYIFFRAGANEVAQCIDAETGKDLWTDRNEAPAIMGPASGFQGPRSSPAVSDGKVLTLGAHGVLSCLDAATGKVLWRRNNLAGALPKFFTSCSPIVVDGMCIVQVGGEGGGAILACDLATGADKWRWDGDGSAYASPVLQVLDGAKTIVAETAGNIVGVGAADGKLLWKIPFAAQQRSYNAATPIIDGSTVIFSGGNRGTKAVKIEKQGDAYAAKESWSNADKSVQFNTPVLKDGLLYGVTQANEFFCLNAKDGKTAWGAPAPAAGGGGGRMRGGGYASIVDAGPVLFGLTPGSQLVVFEPSDKEFKQIASYKIADAPTHAHPVVSGNRIFIKDKDSIALWVVDQD